MFCMVEFQNHLTNVCLYRAMRPVLEDQGHCWVFKLYAYARGQYSCPARNYLACKVGFLNYLA